MEGMEARLVELWRTEMKMMREELSSHMAALHQRFDQQGARMDDMISSLATTTSRLRGAAADSTPSAPATTVGLASVVSSLKTSVVMYPTHVEAAPHVTNLIAVKPRYLGVNSFGRIICKASTRRQARGGRSFRKASTARQPPPPCKEELVVNLQQPGNRASEVFDEMPRGANEPSAGEEFATSLQQAESSMVISDREGDDTAAWLWQALVVRDDYLVFVEMPQVIKLQQRQSQDQSLVRECAIKEYLVSSESAWYAWRDQDTRYIDDHGWLTLDWKISDAWQVFEEMPPWGRGAFSPWRCNTMEVIQFQQEDHDDSMNPIHSRGVVAFKKPWDPAILVVLIHCSCSAGKEEFSLLLQVLGGSTRSIQAKEKCPPCLETMDLTDKQLKPCKCGYDICLWCWHHIMEMDQKDECVGMPSEFAKDRVLRQKNFLGQYGKIENIIIDNIGANQQIPDSGCVYVTFSREEEAVRCIEAVNGYILDGRLLKATFGVTRYCHVWLSNKVCRKPNCSYVHPKAPAEDICTKDDVAVVCARLQHLLGMDMKGLQQRSGSTLPSPGDCNSRTTICSGNSKDKTCINDDRVLPNVGNKNPGILLPLLGDKQIFPGAVVSAPKERLREDEARWTEVVMLGLSEALAVWTERWSLGPAHVRDI